ncbi:MAG: TetR/AcrR family transcriptional regulator [Spirochaetia bacterium]|nr:TetR/AcrR family transcriptional regulator [Spirochaetia bacterium]
MKKGIETRERLIATTGRLLQSQGYAATGINEILDASGTPRGSFYFHFPGGKEELARAALEASATERRAIIERAANSSKDLGKALSAVCEALAQILVESDFQLGCPLATTALETAAQVDAIQSVIAEHYYSWIKLIEGRIQQTEMPPAERAALATLVLSAVEGALLLSRSFRDPKPLKQVAASLAKAIPKTRD